MLEELGEELLNFREEETSCLLLVLYVRIFRKSFHSLSWPQDGDDFSAGEKPLNRVADILNVDNKCRGVVGESENGG